MHAFVILVSGTQNPLSQRYTLFRVYTNDKFKLKYAIAEERNGQTMMKNKQKKKTNPNETAKRVRANVF